MKKDYTERAGTGNPLWWLVWAAVMMVACRSNGLRAGESELYAEYQVMGSEEQQDVTCLFQFKDDREARPRRLIPPSYVLLDRLELVPDSSRLTGVFYEMQFPASNFIGKHRVSYHNGDEPFTEEFDYTPFTLASELPDSISRRDFVIQLAALNGEGEFHVSLTDTSFTSNDFYDVVPVQKGALRLLPEQLNGLKKGPIVLEIIREEDRPLRNQPGQIRISYSLRREFVLSD
jgi:hypothetical protein